MGCGASVRGDPSSSTSAVVPAEGIRQPQLQRKGSTSEGFVSLKQLVEEPTTKFWFVQRDHLLQARGTLPRWQTAKQMGWLIQEEISLLDAAQHSWKHGIVAVSHRWWSKGHPDPEGMKLPMIQAYLQQRPAIDLVWLDYCSMPQKLPDGQDDRTEEERREFKRMLVEVNTVYLSSSVLILADDEYPRRFWTSFESWMAFQEATVDGMRPTTTRERHHIQCMVGSSPTLEEDLKNTWGSRSTKDAYTHLASSDIVVTNQSDKDAQLPKLHHLEDIMKSVLAVRSCRNEVVSCADEHGTGSPITLEAVLSMATTLVETLRPDIAITLQRYVHGAVSQDPAEKRLTARALHGLGHSLRTLGRYEEAQQMERQCLQIQEQTLGRQHPDTLMTLGNLASTLWNLGRYEEAEQLGRACWLARQEALGRQHPHTLTTLSILASTLSHLGRFEEAEQMGRECLQAKESTLGRGHPETLLTLSSLALTVAHLGRYEEAEQMERECLQAEEETFGRQHPHTLTTLSHLANTLCQLGRYEEAEQKQRQCLRAEEETLGRRHPHTLTTLSNLANTLRLSGRYAEAEQLQRECVQAEEEALGLQHPHTQSTLRNFATTLWHLGKFEEAEMMQRKSSAAKEEPD